MYPRPRSPAIFPPRRLPSAYAHTDRCSNDNVWHCAAQNDVTKDRVLAGAATSRRAKIRFVNLKDACDGVEQDGKESSDEANKDNARLNVREKDN